MKMNEIIRERRLMEELTQEQVADRLGVTASAVNKWERGFTCPDITLLAPLARLLKTDLNTLLSFREELTREEIAAFINHVSETGMAEGVEIAAGMVMKKIGEYPNCHELILNSALILEGLLAVSVPENLEKYEKEIEGLYERALESGNLQVKNQARFYLVSTYMKRCEYERAEKLLEELPDENWFDKRQLRINLHIKKGELQEAARVAESKLLFSMTNDIYYCLMVLLDIAIKEERWKDAETVADISRKAAELFELSEYSSYVAEFLIASAKKDVVRSRSLMDKMLSALDGGWDITSSVLYRNLNRTNGQGTMEFTKQMLLKGIESDEEFAYLREDVKPCI